MNETAAAAVLHLLGTRGEMSGRDLRFALREEGFKMPLVSFYAMMGDMIYDTSVYRRDIKRYIAPRFDVQEPHFRLPSLDAQFTSE